MNRLNRRSVRLGTLLVVLLLVSVGVVPTPAAADDVDVNIQGIDDPLKANVRKLLSLTNEHKKPWSGGYIQRLFRLAPKEIKQALQPYGYFNPEIKAHLEKPGKGGKTWKARFKIQHGPATKITRLNIGVEGPGKNLDAIQHALHSTRLKKGNRLIQSRYSDTKSALHDAAYNAGYLRANFPQSSIRVSPKNNTAAIDLVLNTGPRYYFGPVTFKQNLLTDQFVHRFVPFSPGQPYDAEKLIDLQLKLSDSGYYSQVEIQAPRDKARRVPGLHEQFNHLLFPRLAPPESGSELRIPVMVKAKASKGQVYRVAPGYGTNTGPRLGLGVKFPHINKYGHQFRTDLRVSERQRTLRSSYDIPIKDVTRDKLSFTAKVSNERWGDITSMLYGLGIIRDTGWSLGHQRIYLKFEREDYDLGPGRGGNRHSWLLYPGYNISLQKADSLVFTRKGVSLSLDVRGASEALASSTNFIRADIAGHAVVPVTATTRLVFRTELGAISASDFREVPPSQRFYAGGSFSVRGYSYQSISPTNDDNDDIGGRFLATGSAEADWFFYKKFGIAAFFDAGDVTDHIGDYDLQKGVGIGFRWGSPVGMVRFDVAHPLMNSTHHGIRIHFSIGPDL